MFISNLIFLLLGITCFELKRYLKRDLCFLGWMFLWMMAINSAKAMDDYFWVVLLFVTGFSFYLIDRMQVGYITNKIAYWGFTTLSFLYIFVGLNFFFIAVSIAIIYVLLLRLIFQSIHRKNKMNLNKIYYMWIIL